MTEASETIITRCQKVGARGCQITKTCWILTPYLGNSKPVINKATARYKAENNHRIYSLTLRDNHENTQTTKKLTKLDSRYKSIKNKIKKMNRKRTH